MERTIINCLLFLYSFASLFAQVSVIHYNTSNGLPHDTTYRIFQDHQGFIWIGTDDGLVKFDGQDFKLFSTDDGLRNNFVIDVNQDSKGDLFVATWGGGLHIIRDDKVLKTRILNDENEKINNLQIWNDNIIAKHTRGNILYQITKNGYVKKLLTKEGDELKIRDYNKIVSGRYYLTMIDNTPFLLNDVKTFYHNIPTYDRGLYKLSENKLVPLTKKFDNKIINYISKTDLNTYAIAIQDSVFLLNQNKLHKYKLQFDDEKKIICKIKKIGNDEYLILVSNKKGFKDVYLFSNHFKSSRNFKSIIKTQSSISDFLIDHEGNIWISTNGDGVFFYNKNMTFFKNLSDNKLPENQIIDIDERNSIKYLLSPNYLSFYDAENKIGTYKLNGIGKHITLIDSLNLVVSSLNIEKEIRHRFVKEILAFNVIHLKNRRNIYVNDSIYVEYFDRKFPTLKKNINDAIFYQDTLWFATNLGMYYFLKSSKNLVKKNVGSKKFPSEYIRKFIWDKNCLWIATNKGLCCLKSNRIKYYTTKEGLISNHINTMIVDHLGKLWVGTNRGISVFDGKNFVNLTTSRGLLSPFINTVYENSDNQIMVGSDKGVTIINNTQPLKLERPPLINVKQHGNNFHYNVISFNRANSLVVEYCLNSSDWITLSAPKGTLSFSKERKGSYFIRFRAKKQDGTWGYSKGYKFSITIPWYKDVVYTSLLISLLCILIIIAIVIQLQKVKRKNQILKDAIERQQQLETQLKEVRTNIAQDFHDELGNKLARISLISNLALGEISSENEKLKRKIIQIENDTNLLYKGTKDFIFSLKDNSDDLEELVTYLSDFGEDLFSNTTIKFLVEKEIHNSVLLPHYWSKQLIYIYKEALTNAMKHSKCTEILFKFNYSNSVLTISCQDDGIGITDDVIHKSNNGIFNMKKRAKKIGGNLVICQPKIGGTLILFKGNTTQ